MKLGNYAHVSISVHSLQESTPFYEKLGFQKLWGNHEPHPWALFTDGKVNIHLYEFYFPSPALHYFSTHMKDRVLELMRIGIRPEQQKSRDGKRIQHNFLDPNELTIMLMHHNETEMPKQTGESLSKLGVFGELSINTDNVKASVGFWEKLSFTTTFKSEKPYPWTILSDGAMTIGLHQTTTFTTPALTYFANDAAERVQLLKSESFQVADELKNESGEVEGAILRAPDGQLFFVLKGSV